MEAAPAMGTQIVRRGPGQCLLAQPPRFPEVAHALPERLILERQGGRRSTEGERVICRSEPHVFDGAIRRG